MNIYYGTSHAHVYTYRTDRKFDEIRTQYVVPVEKETRFVPSNLRIVNRQL